MQNKEIRNLTCYMKKSSIIWYHIWFWFDLVSWPHTQCEIPHLSILEEESAMYPPHDKGSYSHASFFAYYYYGVS